QAGSAAALAGIDGDPVGFAHPLSPGVSIVEASIIIAASPRTPRSSRGLFGLCLVHCLVLVCAIGSLVDGLGRADVRKTGRGRSHVELAGDDIGDEARAEFLDEG